MDLINELEDLKKSNEENKLCSCILKLHFTDQNICIQNLKPNHYESGFEDVLDENRSEFIKSILEGMKQRNGEEIEFLCQREDLENFKNIFSEIRSGFKDLNTAEEEIILQ